MTIYPNLKYDYRVYAPHFWGALLQAYKGIEEACQGISHDMVRVRVVLRDMKAEGLITPTGKGRVAKWKQIPQAIGQAIRAQPNSSGKKP